MMAGLPAGYASQRERGAVVVALPSVLEEVTAAVRGHGSMHAAALARGGERFRGRTVACVLATSDGDVVVRRYVRGGVVGRLAKRSYMRTGEPRPLRELRASVAARSRGVRTPEVAAASVRGGVLSYGGEIATRRVPDARDLAELEFASDDGAGESAWRAAGALLRTAFAAGVVHADLNLMNILIASDGAWLIDLDRAEVREGRVSDVAQDRMLQRLHRSRRKLEAKHGRQVHDATLTAFRAGLRDG